MFSDRNQDSRRKKKHNRRYVEMQIKYYNRGTDITIEFYSEKIAKIAEVHATASLLDSLAYFSPTRIVYRMIWGSSCHCSETTRNNKDQ